MKDRRQPRARPVLVGLLLAALVVSGCGPSAPGVLNVGLKYRRQGQLPDALAKVEVPSDARLYIALVADVRKDPGLIGKSSSSDEGRNYIRSTGSLPADYLRDALTHQLGRAGFSIQQTQKGASLVLSTQVMTFFVREGQDYEAEVSARFELRDKAGDVVFAQRVTGTKSQWGRTLSEENYEEVIAKATAELIANLVSHPGFKRALAER